MNAIEFIQACEHRGIVLAVEGDSLTYEADEISDKTLDYLKTHKAEVIGVLTLGKDKIIHAADEDWPILADNSPKLKAFIHCLMHTHLMQQGICPPNMTKACECGHCGSVWLEEESSDYVLGCPWCHHVVKGVEIPRPMTETLEALYRRNNDEQSNSQAA